MIELSIILSAIDVNSADSIAKMVNPDAEVTNPLWWIAVLVAIMLGVGYYLLKHYFKITILDGRPKPHMRIYEEGQKKTVIYLQKSPVADIDAETAKRLQEKMYELEQKYPMKDLDVFNNMYLAIPGRFEEAQNYNADVKDYMNDMRLYHSRLIKDRIMTDCYKKVQFVLYGKGKKACNNLIIEVSIKGDNIHVYTADSRQVKMTNMMWNLIKISWIEAISSMLSFQTIEKIMSMVNGNCKANPRQFVIPVRTW